MIGSLIQYILLPLGRNVIKSAIDMRTKRCPLSPISHYVLGIASGSLITHGIFIYKNNKDSKKQINNVPKEHDTK